MKKYFGLAVVFALSSITMQAHASGPSATISEVGTSGQYQAEQIKTPKARAQLTSSLCDIAKVDAQEKLDTNCRRQFGNNGEDGFTSAYEMVGSCSLKDLGSNKYSAEMEMQATCSQSNE